jgi:Peptidase inhibitor family I36
VRVKRLLAAFSIMVLGTVGTLAVTAAPAQATACASGQLCTYWNVMSGDPMYYYTTPIWTCLNIGSTWNNQISSIDNRRSFRVTIWDDFGCTGAHVSLGASTYIYDLGWPDLFNDRASSISFGW